MAKAGLGKEKDKIHLFQAKEETASRANLLKKRAASSLQLLKIRSIRKIRGA
jgi:hypothetical protein